MEQLFYIVELRPEWTGNPCIALWRPDEAGCAFPLVWAGKYTREQIVEGGERYTTKAGGKYYQRFAVPCEIIERMAAPLSSRVVDSWEEGPHLLNTGRTRVALRNARYRLPCEQSNG